MLELLGMGLVNFGARTKPFSLMLNNIIKRLQDVSRLGFDVAFLIFLNDGVVAWRLTWTYIHFGIQSLFCAMECCMLLKSNAIFLHDSTLIIMDWYQDHFQTGRPEFLTAGTVFIHFALGKYCRKIIEIFKSNKLQRK